MRASRRPAATGRGRTSFAAPKGPAPQADGERVQFLSVAPHDVDGLLRAATAGNSDALRRATQHIRPVGRRDIWRKAMGPIPGNIVGGGVADIV